MLGAMDLACITMVVDTSGDACGCVHDSVLATVGIVASGPWSAGGPVGGDTTRGMRLSMDRQRGVHTENGCKTFNWCESLHGTRRGQYWRDN